MTPSEALIVFIFNVYQFYQLFLMCINSVGNLYKKNLSSGYI